MTRIEKIKALCEAAKNSGDMWERTKAKSAMSAHTPELLELVQEMAGALEFYVDGHHEDPAKATLSKYKAWNEGE